MADTEYELLKYALDINLPLRWLQRDEKPWKTHFDCVGKWMDIVMADSHVTKLSRRGFVARWQIGQQLYEASTLVGVIAGSFKVWKIYRDKVLSEIEQAFGAVLGQKICPISPTPRLSLLNSGAFDISETNMTSSGKRSPESFSFTVCIRQR